MKCPKCDRQIDDEQAKFCPHCGANLAVMTSAQTSGGMKATGMFCRNCGKQLVGTPEICMNCGAMPLAGNSFCPACGAATNALAEICIKCGARLATEKAGGKSKTASVLLAVFLAFWTWLYTYKKDAWKFWVGVGLAILIIVLAIVSAGTSLLATWIISLGVWIWAIVDVAIKNDKWYRSY